MTDPITDVINFNQLRTWVEVEKQYGSFSSRGEDVLALIQIAEAARSLHAGLTSRHDPMDVDERIDRLGAALTRFNFTDNPA